MINNRMVVREHTFHLVFISDVEIKVLIDNDTSYYAYIQWSEQHQKWSYRSRLCGFITTSNWLKALNGTFDFLREEQAGDKRYEEKQLNDKKMKIIKLIESL